MADLTLPHPDTDRNLLFGVLALQADLIDNDQFAEACGAWAARKTKPLAGLLVERGWLGQGDRDFLDGLLRRKVHKHGGDVRKSLGAVADAGVRDVLRSIDDSAIRKSVSTLPPAAGYVLVETVNPPSE